MKISFLFTEGASVDCTRYKTVVIKGDFERQCWRSQPPDYPSLSQSPLGTLSLFSKSVGLFLFGKCSVFV